MEGGKRRDVAMQGSGGQLGVPLIASAGAASLPGAEDFRRRTSATRSESSRRSRCRELASDIADGAASAFATCHWPLVSNAHFRPCARGSPGFKARDRRGRFAESEKVRRPRRPKRYVRDREPRAARDAKGRGVWRAGAPAVADTPVDFERVACG